jgi:NAD+ kinase
MIPTMAMPKSDTRPQARPALGEQRPAFESGRCCIGLVVHPTRAIDGALAELRRWSAANGINLVQLPGFSDQQRVASQGDAVDCDLIMSIGGDGTTLAAIRAGISVARPVLGVACGSLGALTAVAVDRLTIALDRFTAGDWVARSLPALDIVRDGREPLFALNDLVVMRTGAGQVRLMALLDGTLFARISGDGCIVSTPLGSSAYSLSARGPLLAPDTDAFLWTPLSPHGGSCPPLVVSSKSSLELDVTAGYGGARLEIDGQVADAQATRLTITLRTDAATLVGFPDQEPFLTGLRRRMIITDSPRFLAEDARFAQR